MAQRTYDLTTTVPTDPVSAIDFLMDIDRHHDLHPFLVSAEVVDQGTGARGPWWDWRVHERPTLGPLRYPIRFPARLVRTSATSMETVVRPAPGCRLRAWIEAAPSDGGGVLTERLEISAPPLLVGYMGTKAHEAHARTFRLLPSVLTQPRG